MQDIRSFFRWTKAWLLTAAGLLLFFHACRWIALFYYGPWKYLFRDKKHDLLKALGVSLRFDGVTVCYGLAIPLLAYLIWICFPYERVRRILTGFERGYFVFLVGFLIILTGVDLGYYSYFQDHINVLIFGFFEDDTWALVRTFQKNYPVFLIFGVGFLIFLGLVWVSRQLFQRERWTSPVARVNPRLWATYFVAILLIGVGARGSIGLFPLHEIDAAVSPEPFINYLGYSGLHGLHRAIKVRSLNNSVWNSNGQFYGYSDWQQAGRDFFKKTELPEDPLDLLKQTTPANAWAAKTKPHVVLVLMESWGGYWMRYNSPTFNVEGAFTQHKNEDFTFLNFLPSMGATIGSLTALMVNSPHRPDGNFLSESRYMQVPFRFSPAQAFKLAGYRTRFVYGGGIGWRSVDRFSKIQGFESIEGDFAIEEKLSKKLEKHDWGIYDGDVFEYVEQTLKEATTPEFVFILTTSNHPPYQVPKDYQPLPLTAPADLQAQFTSDRSITDARFRSYQYANNMLGGFMSRLKAGPLGEKTIVGATGDHGFLLINYAEGELLEKWQVPFYLYVPKAGRPLTPYKSNVTARFGSHMDIFPTLFAMSLSNTTHYSFGNNLFDDKAPHRAFHFSRLAMSADGAVLAEKTPRYFSWSKNILVPSEPTPPLKDLNTSYGSLMSFLDYFYDYELQHSKLGTGKHANTGR